MTILGNTGTSDVVLQVQASNDLVTWSLLATLSAGPTSWTPAQGATVTDNGGQVTVLDGTTTSTNGRRFLPADIDADKKFTNPGIFSSQAELETIRRRVSTHNSSDPMIAGWQSVMSSRFNNANYQPPPAAIVRATTSQGDRAGRWSCGAG